MLVLFSQRDPIERARFGYGLVEALRRHRRESATYVDAGAPLRGTLPAAVELAEAHLGAQAPTAAVVALPAEARPLDFAQAAFWLPRHAHWPVYRALPTGPAEAAVADFMAALAAGEPALRLEPWRPAPPRIETERLTLTVPPAPLVGPYYAALRQANVFDWLIWAGPDGVDDLLDWWQQAARMAARGPGAPLALGIIERASGALIGSVSVRPQGKVPGALELGYLLLDPWQGRGLASEAVHAFVDALFSTRPLRRIEADVFVGNTPSERLLARLGFRCEGTARAALAKNGCPLDVTRWALVRPDWRPGPTARVFNLS